MRFTGAIFAAVSQDRHARFAIGGRTDPSSPFGIRNMPACCQAGDPIVGPLLGSVPAG